MAVSPNSVEENRTFAQKLGLSFPVLADPDMAVTDAYGVRHVGAAGPNDLPFPTTFVLNGTGNLHTKFTNSSYRERPAECDVLAALRDASVVSR